MGGARGDHALGPRGPAGAPRRRGPGDHPPETGPNALRVLDRILGFLDLAGFGPGEAVQIGQAFTRSTLSLVALEATMLPGLAPAGQAELTARARREIEALPREEFAFIAAAAPHLVGPYEPRRSFEVGLELLHDGITAWLPHPRRAVP